MSSTRKVTINVTEKNIAEGKPQRSWCCSIALAVLDALNTNYESNVPLTSRTVSVVPNCIFPVDCSWNLILGNDNNRHIIRLPENACQLADRFDNDQWVEPITFELDIPGDFFK